MDKLEEIKIIKDMIEDQKRSIIFSMEDYVISKSEYIKNWSNELAVLKTKQLLLLKDLLNEIEAKPDQEQSEEQE